MTTSPSFIPQLNLPQTQGQGETRKPAAQSSLLGSYWAGGWDLYLHNARAIAQAYMPPTQTA